MIDKNYHDHALETYGETCEICGYRVNLEVHHINYQEHQEIENRIRTAYNHRTVGDNQSIFLSLLDGAKKLGWDIFDAKTFQLSKDDSTNNLAVLCGNCHSLVHKVDMGKLLLKALKTRK
jgi:hypothetical protein